MFLSRSGAIFVICIFFVCFVFNSALENPYCRLDCDYVVKFFKHTVCERQNEKCSAGPLCGPDFRVVKLTDADRQYILDIHNYLRNKVALGYEKRNNQPPAANMNIMTYNMELEYIAQCWANACNGNPLNHDQCRRTSEYSHVGQNLGFIYSSISEINIVKALKQLILIWYDEVALFKNEWINSTEDRNGIKVGHYTQMLWADTIEIGCATTYYTTPSDKNLTNVDLWHNLLLVCNYGPGGNYIGAPLYEIGRPTSNCPKGTKRNEKFKGLCGKSKHVKSSRKLFEIGDLAVSLNQLFV
ncbi:unnamed protein product [Brassicogethes aeneus]|uniref:SCP domain-containing protein n=1 Tax=Brassicogethes aeneus TaxID=1431903 RepID=A0A9P0BD08_BRAAE|nr:unnamed protein product [Brassicogethes aeneus]